MRTLMILLMLRFILPPVVAVSQAAYEIPFASSGNVIELTVENASHVRLSTLTVRANNLPSWIRFEAQEAVLEDLAGRAKGLARFIFSVDKAAPVNTEHPLSFTILSTHGQSWTTSIAVRISPPRSFELFQNYPNPFNPTTTISYQLSSPSKVHLVLYNLVGQEVTTLVNAVREAGFHQETLNASGLPSGLYIYRITSTDESGHQVIQNKTMSLIK